MALFRHSGPICQTKSWYDGMDDGTLVRTRLTSPSPVGSTGGGKQNQAATQTAACGYLQPRRTGTVRVPQAEFDRLRARSGAAVVGQAQAIAAQTWRDQTSSAAVGLSIQIDGHTIDVVQPTSADAAGKNLPATDQLAEALRALPASQRAHTTSVVLSPRPHPSSTRRATIAGDAGSGVITLFPLRSAQSQNDFDNRIAHESGHNYQGSLWTSGAAVRAWGTAAAADNRLPSPYAGNNAGDDFCEFLILYNAARGTACAATAQQLYPNRWQKMASYP